MITGNSGLSFSFSELCNKKCAYRCGDRKKDKPAERTLFAARKIFDALEGGIEKRGIFLAEGIAAEYERAYGGVDKAGGDRSKYGICIFSHQTQKNVKRQQIDGDYQTAAEKSKVKGYIK